MEISLVVAIVPTLMLEKVEKKLQETRVPGVTVSKVKGYGEYANFFTPDWMVEQAKIELFTERGRAELIVQAILSVAHAESPGAGIVAVLPVEKFFSVRTHAEAVPNRPQP